MNHFRCSCILNLIVARLDLFINHRIIVKYAMNKTVRPAFVQRHNIYFKGTTTLSFNNSPSVNKGVDGTVFNIHHWDLDVFQSGTRNKENTFSYMRQFRHHWPTCTQ